MSEDLGGWESSCGYLRVWTIRMACLWYNDLIWEIGKESELLPCFLSDLGSQIIVFGTRGMARGWYRRGKDMELEM